MYVRTVQYVQYVQYVSSHTFQGGGAQPKQTFGELESRCGCGGGVGLDWRDGVFRQPCLVVAGPSRLSMGAVSLQYSTYVRTVH